MKKTVGMILLICIVVIVGPAKFLNSSLINHIIEKKARHVFTQEYRSLIIVNNLLPENIPSKVKLFTSDGIIICSKKLSSRTDNIILANYDKKKVYKDINSFKIVIEYKSSKYEKRFEANSKGPTIVELSEKDLIWSKNNEPKKNNKK